LTTAIVGGLAGASIGLALDNGNSAPGPTSADSSATTSTPLDPEQIYRSDSPGVVVITDQQTQVVPASLFTPAQKEQVTALGSGFVIDTRGDIVTNDHVVQGAKDIQVGFSGGASYPGTIVGTDPSTDIAVVRVKAPASVLHPLQFAGSSVQVGDPAYAIGNPFGLDGTMTAGIISATGRSVQAPNGLSIPNAIQTDAPINHGNSGGPLLDRFGHVIGINSQIEGGTVDANVGVGFAIPTATVRAIADQLIATGHVEHAWLGVEVATIDASVTKVVRGLPSHGVVVVKVVNGSPAAKAGLDAAKQQASGNGTSTFAGADAIVSVDSQPVTSTTQLSDIIALHKPGETLELQVVRGGKSRTVDVTLGDAPA
jgi:S1-C subfamily serine protease